MTENCRLNVRLKPRARMCDVGIDDEDRVTISVTSPPTDGKANAHAITVLSKVLRVPKSACTIVRGQASRDKVIAIEGLNERTVRAILAKKRQ